MCISTVTGRVSFSGVRGPTKDFKPVPEAKVELKVPSQDTKPFADPRYWAAFIRIGDPN